MHIRPCTSKTQKSRGQAEQPAAFQAKVGQLNQTRHMQRVPWRDCHKSNSDDVHAMNEIMVAASNKARLGGASILKRLDKWVVVHKRQSARHHHARSRGSIHCESQGQGQAHLMHISHKSISSRGYCTCTSGVARNQPSTQMSAGNAHHSSKLRLQGHKLHKRRT